MPELPVVLERPDPRDEAVLAWIAEWLGLRLSSSEAPDGPVVYRGSHPPDGVRGIVIPRRPDDRIWTDLLADRLKPIDAPTRLPFDLVSAIAAHLDDVENRDARRRDRHDRLRYATSFAAEQGFGQVPIVDRYLEVMADLVERELGVRGVPRWPDGRQAAIALSHDVDRPAKWGALHAFATGRRPRARHVPLYGAKVLWTAWQRLRAGPRDDFWLFEPLVQAEAERGFRSTFLFAPTPAFSGEGTPQDVYYDIAWPRFAPIFEMLGERGFEIGLHAGYDAYRSAERLADERERLSRVAGRPIRGLRHHYWHLGPDEGATLRLHEQAGFEWDSSLGYNEHTGFRRSVALPFRPWDQGLGREISTLELPTICMDGALFPTDGTQVADAVASLQDWVERVVVVRGFGALDWHVRTSMPLNREFRAWGSAYLAALDLLAEDTRIWVAGLEGVATWVAERRRRIAAEP